MNIGPGRWPATTLNTCSAASRALSASRGRAHLRQARRLCGEPCGLQTRELHAERAGLRLRARPALGGVDAAAADAAAWLPTIRHTSALPQARPLLCQTNVPTWIFPSAFLPTGTTRRRRTTLRRRLSGCYGAFWMERGSPGPVRERLRGEQRASAASARTTAGWTVRRNCCANSAWRAGRAWLLKPRGSRGVAARGGGALAAPLTAGLLLHRMRRARPALPMTRLFGGGQRVMFVGARRFISNREKRTFLNLALAPGIGAECEQVAIFRSTSPWFGTRGRADRD